MTEHPITESSHGAVDRPALSRRVVPQQITVSTVVGMAAGIALVLLAGWTVMQAQRVLGWALVAVLLAALVWPLRNLLDLHLPKVLATILSIVALILLPATLMVLAFRDLSQQFDNLRVALLEASNNVEASGRFSDLAQRFHLTDQVRRLLETVDPTSGGVGQATSLASALVVVVVLTIFLVADNGRIVRNTLRQFADQPDRLRVAAVLGFAYRRWSRYQLAVLAKAVLIGSLVYTGARLAELPAATVTALLIAATSLVPSVGVVVGGIPVVLLASGFREPWPWGVVAAALIVGLQIADHEVMARLIEPRTTAFGPVVPVVLALIVGQRFGLGAALCSVGVATYAMAIVEAIGVSRRRDTAS
jgi:predicted PurR-regulated permease PerM